MNTCCKKCVCSMGHGCGFNHCKNDDCSCHQPESKDYSHTHCWDNPKLPCGIPLEKHTQCCLCPKLKPESKCEHKWDEISDDNMWERCPRCKSIKHGKVWFSDPTPKDSLAGNLDEEYKQFYYNRGRLDEKEEVKKKLEDILKTL